MYQLIIAIVAIALFSALTAATLSYLPADAAMRQSFQRDVDLGVRALDASVTRYLDANRDGGGKVIYPGDGVDLKPVIAPYYGFLPADIRGEMTWEVKAGHLLGMPAVGVCVRPIAQSTEAQRIALKNIRRTLPVQSAYVGVGCNSTADDDANGDSLTYWVVLAHVN